MALKVHPQSGHSPSQPGTLSHSDRTHSRVRDLIELSVGYLLILAVLWTRRPLQRYLFWAPVLWIIAITLLSFEGWHPTGLRPTRGRLWPLSLALLAAAAAILTARSLHTLHAPISPQAFLLAFWGYSLWSFFQQFILQAVFFLRLQRLLPSDNLAIVAAALLFSLAHLPNPILTVLTLLWGLGACALFLRNRNLYLLGAIHAIFGITLAITVPAAVTHNMRVGRGYLLYSASRHGRHHPPVPLAPPSLPKPTDPPAK